MNDIESSDVLLSVHNNTSPAHVTTASDHDDVSGVELDEICDFALLDVELHGIVGLDEGIRVTDGSAVVSDNVGDTASANSNPADLKELVGGFLRGDAVDGETTLDVVEKAEVLSRLFDGDNIFEYGQLTLSKWKDSAYSPMNPAG